MGVDDLAVVVLQQEGTVAVQHTRNTAIQARRMLAGFNAVTGGFNTDDFNALVVEERVEQAHGV
ncbi:hypothetical protein D1872_342430 [compost metagenome]